VSSAVTDMTGWRTPVVDPGRRAGPNVSDEERKGIQAGIAGRSGTIAIIDVFDSALQGVSGCNVPHSVPSPRTSE